MNITTQEAKIYLLSILTSVQIQIVIQIQNIYYRNRDSISRTKINVM